MSGTEGSWQAEAGRIAAALDGGRARVDLERLRPPVNTYLVRSLDKTALRFSLPVLLTPPPGTASHPGADGAVWAVIEAVKAAVPVEPTRPHRRSRDGAPRPLPAECGTCHADRLTGRHRNGSLATGR